MEIILNDSLEHIIHLIGQEENNNEAISLEGQFLIAKLIEANEKWTDKDKEWIRIFTSRLINGFLDHGKLAIREIPQTRNISELNDKQQFNECIYHYHESISTPIHQLRDMIRIKQDWQERSTVATVFYAVLIALLITTVILIACFWKRIEIPHSCGVTNTSNGNTSSSSGIQATSRSSISASTYWGITD